MTHPPRPERKTRFAPAEATPVNRQRALKIAETTDQLQEFIVEMLTTIDTLWDENDRLQAGIDTHLERCAELRGMFGNADARARTAERLLMLIDPARIDHELSCAGNTGCTCGAIELRARIVVAQGRIREGKHV